MRGRHFAPFFWVQALGAFNDNVFKNVLLLLVTFVAVPRYGWNPGLVNNIAAGLFILPFLLFSAWGGVLADRLDKQRLIRNLKWLELATMAAAGLAIWWQAYTLLLALLFMMGLQSALFGPVKYAILPQHLSRGSLVHANAWVELGTFLAILLGTLMAGPLAILAGGPWRSVIALVLIAIALVGLVISYAIPAAPPVAGGRIGWRPVSETVAVVRSAWQEKRIFPALLGISAFWFLGACYLTQLPQWTRSVVGGGPGAVSLLLAAFAIGVGLGSLICARLSAGRLEIGLIPLGAAIIGLAGLDFAHHEAISVHPMALGELLIQPRLWWMLADLALIGIGGGLYIIPLYTFIQLRSPEGQRARMIAANNVLNALFMVASALFGILVLGVLSASLSLFFALLASMALIIAIGAGLARPRPLMRITIFVLVHLWYRLRLRGREFIPDEGAAVVVCNHVSFMDALILGGASPRPLRFLMDKPIYESPWLNWFFRMAGAIPVESERRDPGGMRRALDTVSEALSNGEVVMVFPEGRLTPNGDVQQFRRGIELILSRNPVPVVPAALSGLWGSWSSRRFGAPFTSVPRRFRARVSLTFAEPIPPEEASRANLEATVRALLAASS
ncbi:MFS transporter [Kushneria phosphatilytica]|uniref:MFS transporter n=1 Tax=Kushneria phosphatilytica TaxID=657387 RepID=A0A5C0ZZH3_9GAMM|nr:MFS transporter [Kushneria phosphatilytica]QEL12050.1 MFS transporter [Kushneria phosphatilytica]